jgi:hypothetical protein
MSGIPVVGWKVSASSNTIQTDTANPTSAAISSHTSRTLLLGNRGMKRSAVAPSSDVSHSGRTMLRV